METARVLPYALTIAAFTAPAARVWAQCRTHLLVPSDSEPLQNFGHGTALANGLALVGAPYGFPPNSGRGAAYVFDASTGDELFKLVPAASSHADQFGFQVALDGPLAVVGARYADPFGDQSGAAYVFDATTGQELFELVAPGTAVGSRLGSAVAAAGGRAVVGAPGHDGNIGRAFVFDTATGALLYTLPAPLGGRFGTSVAISADYVVVGAFVAPASGEDSGAAYVYDATTGTLLYPLVPDDGDPEDRFGISADIAGERLIVGAYSDDVLGQEVSGSVYVFDLPSGNQLLKIIPPDPYGFRNFGVDVAADGGLLLVGSPIDHFMAPGSGSAYVFDLFTGEPVGEFGMPSGATSDHFGQSLALAGTRALVGAPHDEPSGSNSGTAHLFDIRFQRPGTAYCGPAVPNSSGQPAAFASTWGSDLATDQCLSLLVTGLPADEFGYFLASQGQAFVPGPGGSDGDLCLALPIGRYASQVHTSGAAGALALGVDLRAIPTTPAHVVVAGETWNFQVWYRDGLSSNFSDGMSVLFH